MATVYLAHDVKHDRKVALKVLHPELAATLGPERFQREIRTTARLQHPNILTVHDSGEAVGQLWYTMPFVDGESLRGRLQRERQLSVDDALQVAREVADALGYAHSQGVVHRDIKPENILLSRGHALVADFGVARALQAAGSDQLTQAGMSVGTPAYMSPEQSLADPIIDGRSDLYSLGCVLYEMLAGEAPYTGPSAQAIVAKRLREPVPHVRTVRETVPAAVDQALERVLSKTPADRFPTAEAFASALAETAAPSHTQPKQSSARSTTRWSPPRGAMVATAGVLGLLVAGTLWQRHRSGDRVAGRTSGSAAAMRLAVLPFENAGDSADGYFADGLTDAVRDKLTALPGLEVIASASSSHYRHSTKSPEQVGKELGAKYLLAGKVRWAKAPGVASRVQVRPELIDAESGAQRWGEPFDAALTDVFQVQGEIATKVAMALNVALGASQHKTLDAKPTENLAAYDTYLRGRAAMDRALDAADPVKQRKALRLMEESVALDSNLVDAWVDIARAHTEFVFYEQSPTDTLEARKALERAVALAPGTPQVQLILGRYYQVVAHQPAKARAAYEEGLKAAPNHPALLTTLAFLEFESGQFDSAEAHARRAKPLDPRSNFASVIRGLALHVLRRYPEASAAYAHARAIAPADLTALENSILVHLDQGELDSARHMITGAKADVDSTALYSFFANANDLGWVLDSAQQAVVLRQPWEVFGDHPAYRFIIHAQIYRWWGDTSRSRTYADSARRAFDQILRDRPYLTKADQYALRGLALAYLGDKSRAIQEGQRGLERALQVGIAWDAGYIRSTLARIYVAVGEPDRALDEIKTLLDTPSYFGRGWFRIDPNFTALQAHPRFNTLVGSD